MHHHGIRHVWEQFKLQAKLNFVIRSRFSGTKVYLINLSSSGHSGQSILITNLYFFMTKMNVLLCIPLLDAPRIKAFYFRQSVVACYFFKKYLQNWALTWKHFPIDVHRNKKLCTIHIFNVEEERAFWKISFAINYNKLRYWREIKFIRY